MILAHVRNNKVEYESLGSGATVLGDLTDLTEKVIKDIAERYNRPYDEVKSNYIAKYLKGERKNG